MSDPLDEVLAKSAHCKTVKDFYAPRAREVIGRICRPFLDHLYISSTFPTAKPTPPRPLNHAWRGKSKAPGAAGGGGGMSTARTRIHSPGRGEWPRVRTVTRTRRGVCSAARSPMLGCSIVTRTPLGRASTVATWPETIAARDSRSPARRRPGLAIGRRKNRAPRWPARWRRDARRRGAIQPRPSPPPPPGSQALSTARVPDEARNRARCRFPSPPAATGTSAPARPKAIERRPPAIGRRGSGTRGGARGPEAAGPRPRPRPDSSRNHLKPRL